MRTNCRLYPFLGMTLLLLIGMCVPAWAQQNQIPEIRLPDINIQQGKGGGLGFSSPMQLLLFLTVLSLAPYILVMTTSFIRVTIVLSFMRQALGTQQVPQNQVLMAMALFITFYIMAPVGQQINDTALQPYIRNKISQQQFLEKATMPMKEFMFKNARPSDIIFFLKLSKTQMKTKVPDAKSTPLYVLLPAFIVSEVKVAFAIGFLLYIPFLVVDMVVASVLMSMGMFMLSPMTI